MPIEQGSRHSRGFTDEEIRENARGYDADGNLLGGITYEEHGGKGHLTMYDAKHGTRISYDIDSDGNYTKHETNQTANRSHPDQRHGDGCYRMPADYERASAMTGGLAQPGDYYKNYDGNWRRK